MRPLVAKAVLDASALLALLGDKPGADVVAAALPGGLISAVNLAEVVAKLADGGMPEDAIAEAIGSLGLELAPFDEALAFATGMLRVTTRHVGLSLGDRACLALALQRGLPALTADRAWAGLDVAAIRLIR